MDLSAAFGLPPEEAIAFFKAKGYAITWDWHESWKEVNDIAFTVAKVARADVLQDLRSGVQAALERGETERWFADRVTPVLKAKGWWGKKIVVGADGEAEVVQEGSPRRLQTIFRTNVQTAYAAGRWQRFLANAGERPYLQYVAVMDGRTRPGHARLNGKVFRIDDPIWQVIAPPNGFNCRCAVRALSESDLARLGLRVEKAARIETRRVDSAPFINKRTGELDPARLIQRGVSIPDPAWPGKRLTLWADSGWDYNPGLRWGKPFTPPPLDDLPRTFPRGMPLPHLPAPTRAEASRLLPAGLPQQDYARAFLAEFGADVGQPVVFHDAAQGALVIDEGLFQDGLGGWKATKDGRGPFMRLLADAVKAPDEIWLRWEESHAKPGNWLLKRRYIKSFEIDGVDGPQYGLSVFEYGKDGWTGSTAMMSQLGRRIESRRGYIERQRDGFLLYRK